MHGYMNVKSRVLVSEIAVSNPAEGMLTKGYVMLRVVLNVTVLTAREFY